MKSLLASLIIGSLMIAQAAHARGSDYMSRNFTVYSCELFAQNAYRAADHFGRGARLPDVLTYIDTAPVSENEKHRAFQAIQFVWKNQVDNPLMAYSLAMGLCLKPKREMPPMAEPWLTSPMTSREHL
ncbi:MAG: hypothetical protein MI673_06380 [Thiotrichales bacterium]|nr:hypothetical protein [Thiotrichales bacterium]